MNIISLFIVALWLSIIGAWGTNVYKLTQCDFEAPLKCEIVHGIGLIGPLSLFTVWSDTDAVKP